MGSSCKSTGFPKSMSQVSSFFKLSKTHMESMALTPVTEAAFLQNTLKSGKRLELDSTDDPDLQSHFPSASKGIQHDHQV